MTIGVGGNCSAVMPALDTILVCAEGNWGQLEAGKKDSRMNRILGLLARSVDGQGGR